MNIHTNIKEIIKKHGRGIINLTIAVGVSFILSAGSLYFSTGQFGIEMFKSYFANVYTIILNTAPILFVILILLIIVNRLWISVGIASILVIVLSLINYFKLSFRDDPLLVEDLSLFFEMRNMTERYKNPHKQFYAYVDCRYGSYYFYFMENQKKHKNKYKN